MQAQQPHADTRPSPPARLSRGARLTLALGATLTTGADAAPVPADVGRYAMVAAPATECSVTSVTAAVICASSTGTSLAFAGVGSWGEQVIASSTIGVDNFQVHLQGITHIDAAQPYMGVVQFDNITVTGPTSSVLIGVHAHIVGTGAPSAPTYAYGSWAFTMGARNPTPGPTINTVGDWVVPTGRVLQDVGHMWSTTTGGGGSSRPSVDETVSGSLLMTTGQSFEMGSELSILTLNLNVNFTQVQWSYDVPAGYQLTSTRGLSVPAVPEPGGATLLLAGMAGLGYVARRRARNGQVCR
jgi:hypothetical protein